MGRGRSRKRANGEGSIYRRLDGRYVAYFTDGFNEKGRPRKVEFYHKTSSGARQQRDEALARVRQGLPAKPEKQTVGQFLQQWLADCVTDATHAPKTQRSYRDLVDKHIMPVLGRIDLQRLGPADVQRLIKLKSEEGLSPKTVKHIRDVLRAALSTTMSWNLIVRNVATLVKVKVQNRTPDVYDRD